MLNDLKEQAFCVTLKNLRFFFYYPLKWDDETYLRFYFVASFFVRLLTVSSTFGVYSHFFKILQSERVPPVFLCEDLAYMSGYCVCIYCMVSFWLRSREWAKLMRNVTDFTKFGKPYGYKKLVTQLNFVSSMASFSNLITVMVLIYFKLFDTVCPENSTGMVIQNVCIFSPIWFPNIESLSDLYRRLIFVLQVGCLSWYVPATAHASVLCLEMTQIIVLRINHLNKCLEGVFDHESLLITDGKMRFSIRYHQEMLRLCNELVAIMKSHFLFAPVSAVVLASLINMLLLTQNVGVFFLMTTYLVCFFILCFIGQTVEITTSSVAEAALSSKWYKADVKNLRAIRFVVMRSQKPVKLETFPWGHMNYSLYMTIIRAAYSYWTLMRV